MLLPRFFLLAIIALGAARAGDAARSPASSSPADVGAELEKIIRKFNIPGMAAVAVKDGNIIIQGTAGVRAKGNDAKITIDDRFHLGSCTKAMTATLCAGLVEEGKLSWTSTCGEIFKNSVPEMNAAWKSVTLEQLLTNRSGAPGELQQDGLWGKLWSFSGSPSEARLVLARGVFKNPPQAPPGTQYIYSNAGFSIAGAMAEVVTKTPWETLMNERIFKPLQMNSTGYGAPGKAGAFDEPRGHGDKGNFIEVGPGSDNPVAIGPAGIVHCNIKDWSKFIIEHLRGETGGSKLLKPDSYKKLHAPAPGDGQPYAMGWGVTERPWAGGRTLTHSGSNTMWFCVTWLAPNKDFAVLVTCNIGGGGAGAGCDAAAGLLIERAMASDAASRPKAK